MSWKIVSILIYSIRKLNLRSSQCSFLLTKKNTNIKILYELANQFITTESQQNRLLKTRPRKNDWFAWILGKIEIHKKYSSNGNRVSSSFAFHLVYFPFFFVLLEAKEKKWISFHSNEINWISVAIIICNKIEIAFDSTNIGAIYKSLVWKVRAR